MAGSFDASINTTKADSDSLCSLMARGWAELPRDVLATVLLYLHPGDRPTASLVCKAWLRCHDDLCTEACLIEVRMPNSPLPSQSLSLQAATLC